MAHSSLFICLNFCFTDSFLFHFGLAHPFPLFSYPLIVSHTVTVFLKCLLWGGAALSIDLVPFLLFHFHSLAHTPLISLPHSLSLSLFVCLALLMSRVPRSVCNFASNTFGHVICSASSQQHFCDLYACPPLLSVRPSVRPSVRLCFPPAAKSRVNHFSPSSLPLTLSCTAIL